MESICPKGHPSEEPDFCSECGAKMTGAVPAAVASPAPAVAEACPDCGAPREVAGCVFCEICGHNFTTGARGQLQAPPIAAAPPAPVAAAADWTLEVSIDAGLRAEGSPEVPAGFAPFIAALAGPVSLVGRRSDARAIFPEISLDFDDAVSHRHALLTRGADGSLTLRDIGSSNGTRYNGKDVEALHDVALRDGDAITLGHWTRLLVKAG